QIDGAIEPGAGEQERDGFESAQARRMQCAPFAPERRVAMGVEEIRELPGVEDFHVAAEQMTRQVKRGVAEFVDRRELMTVAAIPKFLDAFGGEALGGFVPEAKMN